MHNQRSGSGTPTRRSVLAAALATALPLTSMHAPPHRRLRNHWRSASPPTSPTGDTPVAKVVRGIIDEFTHDYPAITVGIEETPGNDHQTKIKLDASSDRMPDLFNYWRLELGQASAWTRSRAPANFSDISDWTHTDPFFRVCTTIIPGVPPRTTARCSVFPA